MANEVKITPQLVLAQITQCISQCVPATDKATQEYYDVWREAIESIEMRTLAHIIYYRQCLVNERPLPVSKHMECLEIFKKEINLVVQKLNLFEKTEDFNIKFSVFLIEAKQCVDALIPFQSIEWPDENILSYHRFPTRP